MVEASTMEGSMVGRGQHGGLGLEQHGREKCLSST